jgi:glyoxylase-like metal-dependent hydrolase (beta-lactamase superfamily II)
MEGINSPLLQVTKRLFRCVDTCNVYAVIQGEQAVLIDCGDGSILDRLAALGVKQISDVLMTHHHRDQGQGLIRLIQAGAHLWVPQAEQDLFQDVEAHWQARSLANHYNLRQDRFSLLEPVPVFGMLHDYQTYHFGELDFIAVPTPGHTPGSISLMLEIDGVRVAFTGDLIAGPGKVWSLAAMQWSYAGSEGAAASIASLLDVKEKRAHYLLPSHGEPICEPVPAIDLLVERLRRLLEYNRQNPRLFDWLEKPYTPVTQHLLLNRTSDSNSYVLLSQSGKALLIDFGYDFMTGWAPGEDRASRRPWLRSLHALKRDFGVCKIDVAIPTHYHDDHVAGFNLLREVEETQVWAPENFKSILEHPARYDLPCLWYDSIPVDRALPLEEPFVWEEYELYAYPLPGHTRYAACIAFTVDGVRALATGDQYQDGDGRRWNYIYQNRFEAGDYRLSAALYARLSPDLILPGHWEPLWVKPAYLEWLKEQGDLLEAIHQELLPVPVAGFGAEGYGARIQPYQSAVYGGERVELELEIRNPFPQTEEAVARLVAPAGWEVEEEEVRLRLPGGAAGTVKVLVTPPAGLVARRARVAADLTVGSQRFGQQAEALINVLDRKGNGS